MEKMKTLYDISYHLLSIYCSIIEEFDDDCIEDITDKTVKFLNNKTPNFDNLFQYVDDNIKVDKARYKQIMKLTIISSVYKVCLYELSQGINVESNEEIINDLENINYKQIIDLFDEFDENSPLIDYFDIFLGFVSNNYLFYNVVNYEIIKRGKLNKLIELNPYELSNFCFNFKDVDNMNYDEVYIQLYFDLYKKTAAEVYMPRDEGGLEIDEEFLERFKMNIYNYFNNDKTKISDFCGYIFGNIYENLTIVLSDCPSLKKQYNDILTMYNNIDLNKMQSIYFLNLDFFEKLNEIFFSSNSDLEVNDLDYKKHKFKEVGNISIIEKYNRSYNEFNNQKRLKHPET